MNLARKKFFRKQKNGCQNQPNYRKNLKIKSIVNSIKIKLCNSRKPSNPENLCAVCWKIKSSSSDNKKNNFLCLFLYFFWLFPLWFLLLNEWLGITLPYSDNSCCHQWNVLRSLKNDSPINEIREFLNYPWNQKQNWLNQSFSKQSVHLLKKHEQQRGKDPNNQIRFQRVSVFSLLFWESVKARKNHDVASWSSSWWLLVWISSGFFSTMLDNHNFVSKTKFFAIMKLLFLARVIMGHWRIFINNAQHITSFAGHWGTKTNLI